MNRRSFLCAAPAAVALSAVPAIACKTMTLEELAITMPKSSVKRCGSYMAGVGIIL